MVLTHIVDTSVVARLHQPRVAERVRELLVTRSIACTPVTMLEIGFSARSLPEYDALSTGLDAFEPVDLTDVDAQRARAVQRLLAAAGQRGRKVPDLLIAAIAERHGVPVLHYDRDVERIARVTGQPHEWVVRAGSID